MRKHRTSLAKSTALLALKHDTLGQRSPLFFAFHPGIATPKAASEGKKERKPEVRNPGTTAKDNTKNLKLFWQSCFFILEMGLKKESEEDPLERENDVCLSRTSDLTQVGKHIQCTNVKTAGQMERKDRKHPCKPRSRRPSPLSRPHRLTAHRLTKSDVDQTKTRAHARERGFFRTFTCKTPNECCIFA